MKKLITILYFVLPISLFSQSLNENPYLSYYLGNNLQQSSLGTILGRTYDGISKIDLARNIPSNWIGGYSLNHLPVSARHSDFITPFGRSYMSVGAERTGITSVSFLGSALGEMDASLAGRYYVDKKKKLNTAISLNYHHFKGSQDRNGDQFMDLNQKQKFLGFNAWRYKKRNYKGSLTAYHLYLDEIGGQTHFNKDSDYLTTNAYGLGTRLNHTAVGMRNEWSFKYKDLGSRKGLLFFDAEMRLSDMTKFYGLNEYSAKENTLNAYLGYNIFKGLTEWEVGLHFRNENLEESFADSQFTNANIFIPGAYARMEAQFGYYLKIQADIRANYHSNKEFLIHPGVKITYSPTDRMALSAFAGNGTRYARVFTENERFLFSNREVAISETLNPEKAWHYGLSYRARWNPRWYIIDDWEINNINYYFLFYHNIYQNTNIADISDPNLLVFRNHTGKASKTSLSNRLVFSLHRNLFFTFLHRFDVYKTDETGELSDKLYSPKNSFMFSATYQYQQYVFFNTQVHIIGKTPASELAYTNGFAPKRKRWDMSFTVPIKPYMRDVNFFKRFDVILGFDNITGNKLDDVVIGHENPFAQGMDGGLMNGNALGGRFYGGIKVGF